MTFASHVAPLIAGDALDEARASALARFLFDEGSDAQCGAALALLSSRPPTADEIVGFAREMRLRARAVTSPFTDLVDTCGTGGGAPSFNISTSAALLAAGAGARVAKHGNRAATSRCGSADVLERLGVRLAADPSELAERLARHGIAFLFAPHHHPATARVGPVRKELGFRTIFNMLGPLLNPAGARAQVIGVYDPALLRPMAEAMARLRTEAAAIVHGPLPGGGGLDEASPCGTTVWAAVREGQVREGEWQPEDFGLEPVAIAELAPADDLDGAAALVREAISEPDSPRCRASLPTAGLALWIAGHAATPREGAERARLAAADGSAARKLAELAS